MADFKELEEFVTTFYRVEVEPVIDDLVTETAMVGIEHLARKTPVDTSRAISNWQIGIGSPNHRVRKAHQTGRRGSSKTSSAEVTIQKAKARLKASNLEGQSVFISNALPYIELLERGYSKQRRLFVKRAVRKMREFVESQTGQSEDGE